MTRSAPPATRVMAMSLSAIPAPKTIASSQPASIAAMVRGAGQDVDRCEREPVGLRLSRLEIRLVGDR
jgi:hypothetical protein